MVRGEAIEPFLFYSGFAVSTMQHTLDIVFGKEVRARIPSSRGGVESIRRK
jgi:hypothetical protein